MSCSSVAALRAGAWLLLALALSAPDIVLAQAGTATRAPVGAPRAAAFDLSVPNIMRGELLVGRSPSEVRWSDDARYVYFRWREPESGDTTTALYRVAAAGGRPERLADTVAYRTAPALRGSWSRDRRLRAFERNGDIFVSDVRGGERRITDTPGRESSPHLSPDGRTVYFLAGSNVHAVALAGGPLRQLTDLRLEDEPRRREAEGQRRFLEDQQREVIGAIRDQAREREHREAVDSARTRVRPVYLGRGATLGSAEVSPSGRYVLLGVGDRSEPTRTLVPNYVTESGYTENLTVRHKVGDVAVGQRAAVLDLESGTLEWIQPEPQERKRTLLPVGWAPGSDRALLIGTSLDFKDR
jgi:hypothetical protein